MQVLNFPSFEPKFKCNENKRFIFDFIRKKYVSLTPEEWVRQHILHNLVNQKKYPVSLIAVERQFTINGLPKRFDILVFNNTGNPHIVVECKSPKIDITQDSFDQAARYNMSLKSNYLMISNGLNHYFCKIDYKNKRYVFLEDLPMY